MIGGYRGRGFEYKASSKLFPVWSLQLVVLVLFTISIFLPLSFLLLLVLSYALIFFLSCYYCSCLHECCVFAFFETRVFWKQPLYLKQGRGKVCLHTTHPNYVAYVVVVAVILQKISIKTPTHTHTTHTHKKKKAIYNAEPDDPEGTG